MKPLNIKSISLLAASLLPVISIAQSSLELSVIPTATYPANGANVESLDHVVIKMQRGFGAVGYNNSADALKIYIERENGDRIGMVHTTELTAFIEDEWNLEEYNGTSDKRVHTFKDKHYNDLFTRTLGWNGGDGVFTVGLPGGHVFWTFNDSFYGVADATTRARGACSFPRNTIMAQRADESGFPLATENGLDWMVDFIQTSNPQAPGYYKALTHIDHPKASNFNDDGIAQDWVYWSGDGVVTDNGELKMLWQGVDTGNGMIQHGTALATYSLDGEPGSDRYLKLKSVNHDFMPSNPYAYGSTLWEDEDGHIYLYSATGNGAWLGNDPIVARTVTNDIAGEWEYYVANTSGKFSWQRSYPTETQVKRSGIAKGQGSFTLPWVFKKGGTYYMCAQTFPFGREMVIMSSDNPWGPFRNKKVLISFPNPLDELQHDKYGNQYRFLYMLNLHPALSRDGELVISTNTDPADSSEGAGDAFWRNFNNPGSCDWYRPFFYRVYGWENLISGTMTGASDRIDFIPEGGNSITQPGHYKLVCEAGVFGDERFETSGFSQGNANKRIEISFTVGDQAGIDGIITDDNDAPVYYDPQGIRVDHPVNGRLYIEVRGTTTRKIIWNR